VDGGEGATEDCLPFAFGHTNPFDLLVSIRTGLNWGWTLSFSVCWNRTGGL